MRIIDTQCHTGDVWEEPIEVLSQQMEANAVRNAVIVQYNGQYDNTYLLDCVQRFGDRYKAVVLLDPQDCARAKALERLHRQGAAGVRLILKLDWSPDDPVYRLAGELGMVVDTVGKAAYYADARFKRLLDNCPDTQFCVEHLARFAAADVDFADPPHDGFRATLEIAQWPNTTLKIPGLGEFARRPARFPAGGGSIFPRVPPLLDMAKEAFGVQRMMWGSGFPACAGREGYRNALRGIQQYPAFQGEGELDWLLHRSAARVWGFAD